MKNKSAIEQMRDKPVEKYKGGITREHIKQAVEYVFNQEPIKRNPKGVDFIDVVAEGDTLAFSIKTVLDGKERAAKFYSGLGGFINIYNMQVFPPMELLAVRLNGHLLEGEAQKEFWESFYKLKEDYEQR